MVNLHIIIHINNNNYKCVSGGAESAPFLCQAAFKRKQVTASCKFQINIISSQS